MKTRLVLWGTDASDERVLVAIALNAKENKVDIWTFPEQVATETLYNRLINEWRMGKDIPFPQMFVQIERPLTTSDSILPDEIKVERTDLLMRAQTEWQFVVLSARLYETYESELEHLQDRIHDLTAFDKGLWEELKGFWDKVQGQIREKNLFREHAKNLRDSTNELFSVMKEKRKQIDEEFRSQSKENMNALYEKLKDIEERIEQGLGLQPLFEELKRLQKEYRDTKLTKEDRSKFWNRIDKAFKEIKERKYGPGYKKEFSALERLKRRYDGLINAIQKMERSINRDRKEYDFQHKKIEESEGQLEAQIREARVNMVAERISSKEAKLAEMMKTKEDLDRRMEAETKKEDERKAKEEIENVKEDVKEKIAENIKKAAEALHDKEEDLIKAAEAIKGKDGHDPEESDETLLSAAGEAIGESLQNVADTVKAVADVVGKQIAEAIEEQRESQKDAEKTNTGESTSPAPKPRKAEETTSSSEEE